MLQYCIIVIILLAPPLCKLLSLTRELRNVPDKLISNFHQIFRGVMLSVDDGDKLTSASLAKRTRLFVGSADSTEYGGDLVVSLGSLNVL